MKNQHINRRDFLNIVGITAATTTAALYGCAPKDQGGSGSKASSPVPTDQMTYRTFPGLGDKVSLLGYGCMRWPTIPSPDGKGDLIDQDAGLCHRPWGELFRYVARLCAGLVGKGYGDCP